MHRRNSPDLLTHTARLAIGVFMVGSAVAAATWAVRTSPVAEEPAFVVAPGRSSEQPDEELDIRRPPAMHFIVIGRTMEEAVVVAEGMRLGLGANDTMVVVAPPPERRSLVLESLSEEAVGRALSTAGTPVVVVDAALGRR